MEEQIYIQMLINEDCEDDDIIEHIEKEYPESKINIKKTIDYIREHFSSSDNESESLSDISSDELTSDNESEVLSREYDDMFIMDDPVMNNLVDCFIINHSKDQ